MQGSLRGGVLSHLPPSCPRTLCRMHAPPLSPWPHLPAWPHEPVAHPPAHAAPPASPVSPSRLATPPTKTCTWLLSASVHHLFVVVPLFAMSSQAAPCCSSRVGVQLSARGSTATRGTAIQAGPTRPTGALPGWHVDKAPGRRGLACANASQQCACGAVEAIPHCCPRRLPQGNTFGLGLREPSISGFRSCGSVSSCESSGVSCAWPQSSARGLLLLAGVNPHTS